MTDLISRLEGASEGSRELDCLVAKRVGWIRWTPSQAKASSTSHKKHGGWIHPDDTRDGAIVWDSLHGTSIWRDPPSFTTSLDAALTLVPEGWNYQLIHTSALGLTRMASIKPPSEYGWVVPPGPFDGYAATMPLALCIAALKARETGNE